MMSLCLQNFYSQLLLWILVLPHDMPSKACYFQQQAIILVFFLKKCINVKIEQFLHAIQKN